MIPGHEFCGEVVKLGAGTGRDFMGARVTLVHLIPCGTCAYCRLGDYHLCDSYGYLGSRTDGAYAEYVAAPAANLLRVPIGVIAIQWAKVMGPGFTIAVDIFPEKLALASALGADACANGAEGDPVALVLEMTGGRGAERVVEFAGTPVTQAQSLLCVAKRGSCVWGGKSHKGVALSEKTVDAILRREIHLSGSWNSSFAPLLSDWEKSLGAMDRGQLREGDLVSHRLPLDRIAEAFRMMHERRHYFSKVMFFPQPEGSPRA